MKQRFQICLPVTFATGSISIDPHTTVGLETFSITGVTRYNNRRNSSTSSDLWAYVEDRLDSESSLFGWTISEQPTGIKGKTRIVATSASEHCDQITLPTDLALALGFSSGTIPATLQAGGGVLGNYLSYFDSDYRCKGLWIPEDSEMVYFDPFDFEDIATVLAAQSPQGGYTSDTYGTLRYRNLNVKFVRGYSVRQSYTEADFGASYGIDPADPNISWDNFVNYWRTLDTSTNKCRLYLNIEDLSSYKTIHPLVASAWWRRPSAAFELVAEAPLIYEMDIEFLEEV